MLNYVGDDLKADSSKIESAFRTMERAFQRGTSDDTSKLHHDGLLFTMGYSPSYFSRFDSELPESIDLPSSEQLLNRLGEDGPTADSYDAALHLASGFASILLAVEEMLFGSIDRLNSVDVEGSFDGVFERAERRTGFLGKGQPAKKYEHDSISSNAPLSMGFKAGFRDNLPDEDRVTLTTTPFSEGTTQMISRVEIDLDGWYEETREDRVHQMFSPDHTPSQVGELGENLSGHSGKTPETVEKIPQDAEKGLLGHGQKLAQARTDPEEGFVPVLSRRDFDATTGPGLHFPSLQRGLQDFVDTRKAMNGGEYHDQVPDENNGILAYIDVKSRATFLIPPRDLRAMPTPNPNP